MQGEMRFLLKPDCYVGLEQEIEVKFEILPLERKRKEIFLHPDDEEACKRPTLFNQLAAQLGAADSDEEEVDEDDGKKTGEDGEAGAMGTAGETDQLDNGEAEEEELDEEDVGEDMN